MGIVVFDLQHSGKPRGLNERGAKADLDGDGVIDSWEHEAELTPFYVAPASRALALAGHSIVIEAFGEYSDRHARAADLAARFPDVRVAYVACHINAGGGRSGSAFYDGRSGGGARLGALLATELGSIEELYGGFAFASYADPQPGAGEGENEWRGDTSKHWTWGAWSTIAGIYQGPANISGVCAEPWYLDQVAHRPLATGEGAARVGEALARGLASWLET